MKPKILILLLLISIGGFGQTNLILDYNDIETAKKSGKYTSYISKDGTIYDVGDKVTLGLHRTGNWFSFITSGTGFPLIAQYSGWKCEIKKIGIDGSKQKVLRVCSKIKSDFQKEK